MVTFHFFSKAASTCVAMPGLLTMSHSAYVAFFTVKYSLLSCFIIIEAANIAIVLREIFFALNACLPFRLFFFAKETLHHCNFETVKLMTKFHIILIVIHFFVVADSAVVILAFTYWVRTL